MQKYVPMIGWLGMIFGIATAILSWPSLPFLFFAFFTMIPGFLLSSLYIMFSTKYEMETPKINPGYLGIFFSSAPLILFILYAVGI